MDPLCHTLTGAAFGKAGLAKRSPLGMSTLLIAANLPDIDVAVFATDALPMAIRRGWTHGILAQALLPPLLAAVMVGWDRWRRPPAGTARDAADFATLTLLAYAGVLSHVFLDFLNSYGVRLLMPFSDRWFYGDALYIVDPWMYLTLAAGVWLCRSRERRRAPQPSRPARIALLVAGAYVLAMLASNLAARSVVSAGLTRAGRPADTRFMVTPVLVNPFEREVLIDVADRYEKGFLWFEPAPHFRPAGYGVDKNLQDPIVQEALRSPRAVGFMQWARFPFAAPDRSQRPPRVWLNDYRYSGVAGGGWSATEIDLPSP